MDSNRKSELASRLMYYPLLRMLLLDRWFRLGLPIFLGVIALAVLALPKFWVASPPGVVPAIRVSIVDCIQAWSFKRTAHRAVAEGNHEEAQSSWMVAVANNQADVDALRDLLGHFLKHGETLKHTSQVVPQAYWLLQLTGTNVTDLELAARVLARKERWEGVANLLKSVGPSSADEIDALGLKADFELDQMDGFSERWRKCSEAVRTRPEIKLLRAAQIAGWSPPGEGKEGLQGLRNAMNREDQKVLACRLLIKCTARRGEVDDCATALDQLTQWRAGTLSNHIQYWQALLNAGRAADAAKTAQACPLSPVTSHEAIGLVRVFSAAGMPDKALSMFDRYMVEFGDSPEYWLAYLRTLVELGKWNELRMLGPKLRAREATIPMLAGLGYYAEGRAELGQQRPQVADTTFARMAERGIALPSIAKSIALEMVEARRYGTAREILVKHEAEMRLDPGYWSVLFEAAVALKDEDQMFTAAREALRLQPANPECLNNYASALLVARRSPEEAIKLTLQLRSLKPGVLAFELNHAAALVRNSSASEAESILRTMAVDKLSRENRSMYFLTLLETDMALNRFAEAQTVSERIEDELLFPAQIEWIKKQRKKLLGTDGN